MRPRWSWPTQDPTLTLVYLPHLDYDLQRFGPDDAHPRFGKSLLEIDAVAGDLRRRARATGARCRCSLRIRHHAVSTGRSTSTARCATPGCWPSGRRTAASCSIRRIPRLRGRRPSDRTCLRRRSGLVAESAKPGCKRCRRRACLRSRRTGGDRARSSALRRTRRPGRCACLVHLLLLESTTAERPTSRAPSRSTASPATTRSSCFSIRRSLAPKLAIGKRLLCASSDFGR